MADTLRDHLIDYLTDAYSIERQALVQMKTAPDIAGEPRLASAFRRHLEETERQAEMIEKRLEDLGGSPKRVKDAIMAVGGKSFLLFARAQPDTPGKLAAHAYSYEAFEWAAYEMLIRMAERAGDGVTAATARGIRDQERAMMERIESALPAAADASLGKTGRDDLTRLVRSHLADAHALEAQSIQLLEKSPEIAGDPELERVYREHLAETRMHAQWVEERLEALGGSVSKVKDLALRAAALNWGLFFQAQSDTPGKLAVFAFAIEHLEAAGYEMLRQVAERADDEPTVALADRILADERAMAERVAAVFDRAFDASMAELEVTAVGERTAAPEGLLQ